MTSKSRYTYVFVARFTEEQARWIQEQVKAGNAESTAQLLRKLVTSAMRAKENTL